MANKFSAKGGSASGGNKILFFAIIIAFGFGLALFVSADLQNPLGSTTTFTQLIEKIAAIVAQIGLPIAAIVIIYSGLLFATARGSEDKIKTAKTTFYWAIIGTALLLGAWAIARAIGQFINSLK